VYRKWDFKHAKDLVVAIIFVKFFGAFLTAPIFSAKITLSFADGPVSAESLQAIFGSIINPLSTRTIIASLICVIVDAYLILYFYSILLMKLPENEENPNKLHYVKEFLIFTIAAFGTLVVDSLIFVTGAFLGNLHYIDILMTHFLIKLFISVLFGFMMVIALKIIPNDEDDANKLKNE
jgi:uncharacterized PurR-regulated membrane protein YhhQ (DUF165 family)